MIRTPLWIVIFIVSLVCHTQADAQVTLESRLKQARISELAEHANISGDPRRGAIVFFQAESTCTKCHLAENERDRLGPDLAIIRDDVNPEYLVQALLEPSHTIREGFQTVAVQLFDGRTVSGLLVEETDDSLTIRRVEDDAPMKIKMDDIDDWVKTKKSTMPDGLVNILKSDQEFFDLVSYLIEISEGGADRAAALQPPKALYEAQPIPAYESSIDHAGMIASLNRKSFERGKVLYDRQCVNCHGTREKEGSLPTSLRFAEEKFKNGSDPFSMYKTITYGYGMMVRQHWMVPEQKYDVIHYIREEYIKDHNPTQYTRIDQAYLASLPVGDTRGPKPTSDRAWAKMDYGPHLNLTLELGNDGNNIAQKGIAVRLNPGPGGVSHGSHWLLYEHDTMRVAAAWTGDEFIDWNGINFNDKHQVHPRIVGPVHFANPTKPGWGQPSTGSFEDPRLVGRDGKHYGPMPKDWMQYKGIYQYGSQSVIAYSIGQTNVLELPGIQTLGNETVWTRTINLEPTDQPLAIQVAHIESAAGLRSLSAKNNQTIVFNAPTENKISAVEESTVSFDGRGHLVIDHKDVIELTEADYTIAARIKTTKNGTIFCEAPRAGEWARNGKTFFIRNGKLAFDIGWVGAVQGKTKVNDGKWHTVAMSWQHETGRVQFFVDGKLDKSGSLMPKGKVDDSVLKIGFTSEDFPNPSGFQGQIQSVKYFSTALGQDRVESLGNMQEPGDADTTWVMKDVKDRQLKSTGRIELNGKWNGRASKKRASQLMAHVAGLDADSPWSTDGNGNLRLTIPASTQPRNFTIAICRPEQNADMTELGQRVAEQVTSFDLSTFTKGGPGNWPERLQTDLIKDEGRGPFAVDVFKRPEKNPWDCRLRLTGVDFIEDGNVALVCAWDGSVWRVTGIHRDDGKLTWQRIAHGMFQPLGIKVLDGEVFVSCRDQIVRLHDLNGDLETDFYECFNTDHQVTEHFHEFAMGLQTDNDGNLYYAKSARHAKKAVVPHHGTLLKVSRDGSKTEIIANGFRAANGVCINDDGSFIVTDQEGHWNPKNRINWVKPGGFYGNMYGYHDVTDTSDDAMDQPLCWITNSFDRSPAELLWVRSEKWGPLNNSLLNFSYGYGKIYVVPHENIGGQMQGGMCEFPLPRFPTGIMRGRFNELDGQLYSCGMYAWAGDQHQPGGFYRIRYTGKDVFLPVELGASTQQLTIKFSGKLDPESVGETNRYKIKSWALKRTANYGSKHFDEKELSVTKAELLKDGKTVVLTIPKLEPTWCMEIKYGLQSDDGQRFTGTIHNTIHRLKESTKP